MIKTASTLLAVLIWPCATIHAQPPGERLIDQVIAAYAETERYESTISVTSKQQLGRWFSLMSWEIFVAFDRGSGGAGPRLKIDKPDFLTVIRDGKLLVKAEQLSGRYLDQPAPAPLDYTSLVDALTIGRERLLSDPLLLDVAMLLADDPIAALSEGAATGATTLGADPNVPESRPRLRFGVPGGQVTLSLDPETNLIAAATIEVQDRRLQAGEYLRFEYVFDVHHRNQELNADAFAFKPGSATPAPTFQAMAQGGGGGAPGNRVTGQPMPDLTIVSSDGTPVKLSDLDQRVIVLEFWASWCGPCHIALPAMQRVYDWAQKEGKSVAIYAVSVDADRGAAETFWRESGHTMPLLMDQPGMPFQVFGTQGLPATVVIADGVIEDIDEGFPRMNSIEEMQGYLENRMKVRIERLLEREKPAE